MFKQHKAIYKRNASITALPLYYSGPLLKKTNDKKNFEPYFGELRGSQLFLYKHDAQETYTEKLDLEQVKSKDLNKPCVTSAIFTFTLQKEVVLLKVDNLSTGEEWRCYLLTMAKKVIPSNMLLLPGQLFKLREALDQELRRRNLPRLCAPTMPAPSFPPPASLSSASASASSSSSSPQRAAAKPNPSNSDMPACFFNVTRQEAEAMLEHHPQNGNIILRPSSEGNHAVTVRLLLDSGPVLRNFKVTRSHLGLIIHLDIPVRVHSFTDVLNHFLENTVHHLCPYSESQLYDTTIDPLPVQMCNSISSPSPSNIPQAQVKPRHRSQEPENDYEDPDVFRSTDPNPKPDPEESELDRVYRIRKEAIDVKMSRDQGSNEKRLPKGSIGQVEWFTNF
ncbi:signal-transducing adaptor protein 1-like isoform X2 [Solea solea]|uniref:signal-transducing adaptor protein 1-like isoform X2 n=1 Tax=Solea solea TaxID=90069 RepID=UPI00272A305C|nr:signal-transducing adaptor protein 1-like isoform X2 [Solea solea]